ncbi:erylysin A [Pleurotus eryngii]|uniref:Erylysin A n=1 Tax=Pleurotus eryngii TaxID=5323 RepID=D0FZZ2_PLEER|nr:erylysin A [Pleurotus eryngii]BAI45247.1 erylysin A [Pleurotus eryngii]BAN83907.1 Pe.ostreolysin [Pleurotus eryngii]
MAYAQWVIILIHNVGQQNVKIKNLNASWGKLYADGDKDTEVPASKYEGMVIAPDDQVQINACGREDAAEGTTGTFDLVDPNDSDKQVRHFAWDCPWGTKANSWVVGGSNSKWMIEYTGQNLDSGALGTITVNTLRIGN